MGNILGKHKNKKNQRTSSKNDASDDDEGCIETQEKYDRDRIRKLRKLFNTNLDVFVLNHILMSIMFFESYENGIPSAPPKKDNLNPILLKEHQKSCIKPDVAAEVINQNVNFKMQHGPKKNIIEPLLPQKMLIVYDNIEIGHEDENQYSGIDNPTFRARIKHTDRMGYDKLKYITEEGRREGSVNSNVSNNTSVSDNSSGSNEADSEQDVYVYAPINDARTPKPLGTGKVLSKNMPENLVQIIKKKNLQLSEEGQSEVSEESDPEKAAAKLYKNKYYLSSQILMTHFREVCFRSLGNALGFCDEDLSKATYTTRSLFCNDSNNLAHWEIIPAVVISWRVTHYHAFEWFRRTDRSVVTDVHNKKTYQWPSNYMIKELEDMNGVVIPRGYLPKKGTNQGHDLEWEIGFPQLEKYLETSLPHVNMRAYLFLVTLFKAFIEPETEKKGLLIDHIKTHMFWEIERNAMNWPYDRLGTKLLKVLQNLYECLGKSSLPDYFIREKNLFENIPSSKLWKAQEIISNIIQSPVMHFIAALRNLHYAKSEFYEFPDFKKLLETLTGAALKSTNPGLYAYTQTIVGERPRVKLDREREWLRRNEELKRKIKKKQKMETTPEVDAKETPKISADSIDFRWTCKKNIVDDMPKERKILLFFLDHFITIIKQSIAYEAFDQATFYWKQCYYLAKVLQGSAANEIDALRYLDIIDALEREIVGKNQKTKNPPLTPSRNSFYVSKTTEDRSIGPTKVAFNMENIEISEI